MDNYQHYVVMLWNMVTRNGTNMTLAEAVDGIFSRQESEAKEFEIRKREKEEIEKKHKEYYDDERLSIHFYDNFYNESIKLLGKIVRCRWIVTSERYVVMPWKMVTRNGTNMTLAEAVDEIFSRQESEAKELEIRKREK